MSLSAGTVICFELAVDIVQRQHTHTAEKLIIRKLLVRCSISIVTKHNKQYLTMSVNKIDISVVVTYNKC